MLAPLAAGDRLGPYVLDTPLGRGAAGEVWAARHEVVDVRVAVKVLAGVPPAEVAREVRALAGLRHPGIVFPYDHGGDRRVEEGGDEDTAWIAMELATGGTLADAPPAGWPAVREVALSLLDALAHAHAHGVIHRDLKTRNVLVFPGEGVKLSDFSIARARGATPVDARSGSLETMAPEQLRGAPLDQGPWTDLYALGCLVFGLLAGRPAFSGPDAARQHLAEAPPPLPWPAVDAWVRWLMAKDPAARPRCAAEAAAALPPPDAAGAAPEVPRATPVALAPTLAGTAIAPDVAVPDGKAPAGPETAWTAWSPVLPSDWRPVKPAPRLLPGAGLGLLDVRPLPTRGRDAVLDALWAALTDGRDHLHLEGPPGSGRAHLLRHVAVRAAESGATAWLLPRRAGPTALLAAACGLEPGTDDAALPAALRRTCFRLGLPLATAEALAAPDGPDDAALADLLARTPLPRVIAAPEPAEALLPLVADADALVLTSGPPGSAPDGATPLPLSPLPAPVLREILADLVELDPVLADVVVRRADGLPGRALGEVTAWGAAGRLQPGPRGHQLHGEGVQVDDPADPAHAVDAALHWLRNGAPERGLPVLDAAVSALDAQARPAADPARLRVLRMRMGVLLTLGAWEESLALGRHLLDLPGAPTSIRAIAATSVADALTTRGQPRQALAVLDSVDLPADADPGDRGRVALYRAWTSLSLSEGMAEAAAALDACMDEVDPRLRVALRGQRILLAIALDERGEEGEVHARQQVTRALAEAPPERRASLHALSGEVSLLCEGDPAAAVAAYTRALDGLSPANPNRLVPLVNRGVARLCLGDAAAARDAARQALPLLHRAGWKDHEAVAHGLAWATEADPDVAAEHGRRARETAGSSALTARLLGLLEGIVGRELG